VIICYRYNFVFLKTRKTAGSSLEIALSRLCGPGDVVTRLAEESARQEEGGYGPAGQDKPISEYGLRQVWKRLRHGRRATRFSNHADLATARGLAGDELWPRLMRFTSERNPWDKAVSRYYWQKRRWERRRHWSAFPEFSDYLEYLGQEKPHWLSCWDIYALDGDVPIDMFIFYEELERGFQRVVGALGVEHSIKLPRHRAKASGTSTRDYRREYSNRAAEVVSRVCRREIDYFGYAFDAPGQPPGIAVSGDGSKDR